MTSSLLLGLRVLSMAGFLSIRSKVISSPVTEEAEPKGVCTQIDHMSYLIITRSVKLTE